MKKSSLILFVFSLLLLALAGITPAQEAEVLPLHIDTLIEEAVANNPSLEAARHEQKAASLRIKPTGTLPDPTVMLGFMSVPVDTFSFDEMDMTQKIISVSQAFPFPGKLKLAKEIAKSDAEVARWQIKIFEDRLVYELHRSFFNWVFSEEALRITEHNRKVIASFTRIATARYSVGKGNQWDILRAQVEHTKLREMQATIAQNIESLKAGIAGMMGRDEVNMEGTPEVGWIPVNELYERELLNFADEHNPSLAFLNTMVERAENAAKLARRNRLPNFSVTLSYGQRDDGEMNGMDRERPDFVSAMVGVQVPLYARRKQIPLMKSAETIAVAARSRLENGRLRIHADIRDRIYRIRRADMVEKLYRTGIIPQAQTTVRSALSSYQVGKVDFLALLMSELTLMNHELDYYRVRIDREIDFAALALLLGENIFETREEVDNDES